MLFQHRQDGAGNLPFLHRYHIVHIPAHKVEGQVAGGLHLNAVGDGMDGRQREDAVGVDGFHHAGSTRRLHADDLAPGHQMFDGIGRARNESAAADRHQKDVAIGQLPAQLQTDGALAGHDAVIIERMDEGELVLITEPNGLRIGIVIYAGHQHHMGAVAAGGLDLAQGRSFGNADGGGNAHIAGGKGHTLSVVSGGAGNDAPRLFLIRKRRNLIISTTELECAGLLQAICLQIKFAVGNDILCGNYRSVVDHRIKDPLGILQHFHG